MTNVQMNPQVDPANVSRTNMKLVAVIIVLAVVTTLALVVAAFALGRSSSNN
jgi:hypothetical protein